MQIEDGSGSGYIAKVSSDNELHVFSVSESHAAHVSNDKGGTYMAYTTDAGPGAGEYTLYIQNDSSTKIFVIDCVCTSNVDADVVWKLHEVTGTAAGASVVTASNLNLTSGKVAELTCRGGAGGVTGLTSTEVIMAWNGGAVFSNVNKEIGGRIVLGKNNALAVEYDAGTGGAVHVHISGHYHEME